MPNIEIKHPLKKEIHRIFKEEKTGIAYMSKEEKIELIKDKYNLRHGKGKRKKKHKR